MRALSRTITRAKELRRAMSLPEVILWRELRRRAADGARFRRQHSVGPYILDFYCAEARLAVEVDGAAHDHPGRAARDERRDAWLRERGIVVLRFNARDVLHDERRQDVMAAIVAAAAGALRPLHHASHGPPPPLRG